MQKSFAEKVLEVVQGIPRGQTLSYTEVARQADSPGAARAVGRVMATYDSRKYPNIPCHRVIASDGSLGGYRWGIPKKRALLLQEGAVY